MYLFIINDDNSTTIVITVDEWRDVYYYYCGFCSVLIRYTQLSSYFRHSANIQSPYSLCFSLFSIYLSPVNKQLTVIDR